MKRKILYSVLLISGIMSLGIFVNQVYGQTPQNSQIHEQTLKYTCPMHPEVIQDKPGDCPKCGMKLVEMKNDKPGEMNQMNDSTKMKNCTMPRNSTKMKNKCSTTKSGC